MFGDGSRERVLGMSFHRCCKLNHIMLGLTSRNDHVGNQRPPQGQRAGLVKDNRIKLRGSLQRGAVPDQQPQFGPLPHRYHDGSRGRHPSAHGQAIISTLTAARTAISIVPSRNHTVNVTTAIATTVGTKYLAIWSANRAIGALVP